MEKVAALVVEVLTSVYWLGVEIYNQAIPILYYFSIKEHYRILRPLSGEFNGSVDFIDFIWKSPKDSSPCGQIVNMSSMYLQ